MTHYDTDIIAYNSVIIVTRFADGIISESMDDWKARSPHSAAVPPDSIRAIRKWTIVRCLLHARPRYKRSGKCAVSPKKDSTSLKSS